MSEGVRLHGEMFRPASAGEGKLLTIVTAHGWGGTARGLRNDAVQMARAP